MCCACERMRRVEESERIFFKLTRKKTKSKMHQRQHHHHHHHHRHLHRCCIVRSTSSSGYLSCAYNDRHHRAAASSHISTLSSRFPFTFLSASTNHSDCKSCDNSDNNENMNCNYKLSLQQQQPPQTSVLQSFTAQRTMIGLKSPPAMDATATVVCGEHLKLCNTSSTSPLLLSTKQNNNSINSSQSIASTSSPSSSSPPPHHNVCELVPEEKTCIFSDLQYRKNLPTLPPSEFERQHFIDTTNCDDIDYVDDDDDDDCDKVYKCAQSKSIVSNGQFCKHYQYDYRHCRKHRCPHHRDRSNTKRRAKNDQRSDNNNFIQHHLKLLISGVIFIATLTGIFTDVAALRAIRITAPDYIFYGDSMWLNCSADLDYNQIYSVKWFKDNSEMYRFITSDESPRTFYPTTGIVIDETRSNFGNLFLRKTDFKVDADFRCEVLAENDFNTAIEIKKIKVYYIPHDRQPIIYGKKTDFRPNELVNLTCSSPMSMPAARLMVTLNGDTITTANSNYYQREYHTVYENGLATTSVNVQFPKHWLRERKNNFECTSSIVHRFNRSAAIRFEARSDAENRTAYYLASDVGGEQIPFSPTPLAPQSLPLFRGKNQSPQQDSNHIFPQFNHNRLEPKIENFKRKYELGDIVNLRCISVQYKAMPELHWLVDGEPVESQFLDYKQSDFHMNGFVRLDLKLRIGQTFSRNLYPVSATSLPRNVGRKGTLNTMTNRPPDSYTFRCVQVLSDVISVGHEVAELFNFAETHGNSLDGNSVEAVKSLIGNGASGSTVTCIFYHTTVTSFIALLFATFWILA